MQVRGPMEATPRRTELLRQGGERVTCKAMAQALGRDPVDDDPWRLDTPMYRLIRSAHGAPEPGLSVNTGCVAGFALPVSIEDRP